MAIRAAMAAPPSTPGVRFEDADRDDVAVGALRTDIAGFVGLTERGPIDTPVLVSSWEQFATAFGDCVPYGYTAYAVRAFFENGGRSCHVVRVAAPETIVDALPEPAVPGPVERVVTRLVDGASAFVTGAAVTIRQDDVAAVVAVADVDVAASAVRWVAPLPPEIDPRAPFTLATGAGAARATLTTSTGAVALHVLASSPGVWGNHLAVHVTRTHPAATRAADQAQPADGGALYVDRVDGFEDLALVRVTQDGDTGPLVHHRFVVAVDPARNLLRWDVPLDSSFDPARPSTVETLAFGVAVWERGRRRETAHGLSLHPDHPRYVGSSVGLDLVDLLRPDMAPVVPTADEAAAALPRPGPAVPLAGGRDGLARLRVEDFTGTVGVPARTGLRTLETVEDVAIVAVPDVHIRPTPPVEHAPLPVPEPDPCCPAPEPEPEPGPIASPSVHESPPQFTHDEIARVQDAIVEHCESLRDRVAILDAPHGLDPGAVTAWRRRFDTSWAALYYPWVSVVDPLQRDVAPVRMVPPSGHVAGVYAHGDRTVGVHRAPANLGLGWAHGTDIVVDAATQAGLNPLGVNCIREVPARGLQVYGARTMSSDPTLRYVNVRRLLAMIASSLLASLQWAVFEPHDAQLRLLLRLGIGSFLRGLWQAGALSGTRPEEAFFVRCDDATNPAHLVDAGQVRCEIGVAPAIPAEFVVVRIGRVDNEWMVAG